MLDGLSTTSVYSRGRFVNSSFPNKKNLAHKSTFFFFFFLILKQKFCVSSKKEKEYYRKTTSYYLSSALHAKNDTTNLFSYKLGESTENNKVLFSSQVRKQLKLLTVPSKPLRCCLRSDKLVNCHV